MSMFPEWHTRQSAEISRGRGRLFPVKNLADFDSGMSFPARRYAMG